MFTLISSSVKKIFYGGKDVEEVEGSDPDTDDSDIDSIIEHNTQTLRDELSQDLLAVCDAKPVSQHRKGYITSLFDDYGIIDQKYQFSVTDIAVEDLREGCLVSYIAFRCSAQEEWRVSKIISVHEDWDEVDKEDSAKPIPEEEAIEKVSSIFQRTIIGNVVGRNGRAVIVEYTQQRGRDTEVKTVTFHLDKVSSTFTPYEGDYITLSVFVEEDAEVCDLCGEIVDFVNVTPSRARLVRSMKVSTWEGHFGTLSSPDTPPVYFDRESCDKGYVPRVGDEVEAQTIESSHGKVKKDGRLRELCWRAIEVKPVMDLANRESAAVERSKEDPIFGNPRAVLNKCGVVISNNTDFGTLNVGQKKDVFLEICNNGRIPQVIEKTYFLGRRNSQIMLVSPPPNVKVTIMPGEKQALHLVCTGRFYGYKREGFVVDFGKFHIGRVLTCEVTHPELVPELQRNACDGKFSYIRREEAARNQYRKQQNSSSVLRGVRPIKPPAFVPVRMNVFHVPLKIQTAILGDGDGLRRKLSDELDALKKVAPSLEKKLAPDTYSDRFHTLLYVAEVDSQLDMRQYDMPKAKFTRAGPSGEYLALEVPGLAEKRPSLLVGDRIYATNTWQSDARPCEGFIHKVNKRDVWLKFDPSFQLAYNGEDYSVSFDIGRSVWKRCHQAIHLTLAHLGTSVLFPTSVNVHNAQVYLEESLEDRLITALPLPEESLDVPNNSKCDPSSKEERQCQSEDSQVKQFFSSFPNSPKPSAEFQMPCLNDVENNLKRATVTETEQNIGPTCALSQVMKSEAAKTLRAKFFSTVRSPRTDNSEAASLSPQAPTKKESHRSGDGSLNDPSALVADTLSKYDKMVAGEDEKKCHVNCEKGQSETKTFEFCNGQGSSPSVRKAQEELFEGDGRSESHRNLVMTVSKNQDALMKANNTLSKSTVRSCKLQWCNKHLNSRQRDAVRNILKGEARPLPYIIFGPPGTGKTITLVEAILQIYLLMPDSRLLVGTPSNSSADLIAERLLDSGCLQPGDMVRLVAYHVVESGKVPAKLLPYCATTDISSMAPDDPQTGASGVKSYSAHALGRHRITVGTCVSLGQLYNLGFPQGHFTHIVVDEAGQATEPELLIPLAFLDRNSGQSILAGDPLQLGPVVQSRLALKLGLDESFMARLLRRFPYERDPQGFPNSSGYDPRLVTRLSINYRSLPDILDLPSSLFYDSELEPWVSDESSVEAALLKQITDALEIPHKAVVFHGVRGNSLQDDDCPSWHNPMEVLQIVKYITTLFRLDVPVDDIGIITPYRKQAQKIRLTLEMLDLALPKVGSVEEFQGQERMVIIVSTVRSRSNAESVSTDIRHSLGFVASPRRLNVAISRARALLLVIGDPYLLAIDPYWRSVLKHCCSVKAYIGCDLPSDFQSNDDEEPEK